MTFLIVNADDFGASRGINRGIVEAHHCGIVTSASLLVSTPWSEEAAVLSRTAPDLSVGLHVHLTDRETALTAASGRLRAALEEQLSRFRKLMARPPTHLDSHHNVHRDPRLLPCFLDLAHEYQLPLRDHSPVRHFSRFYGQWGGETHPEQISAESLTQILETEIEAGITELLCHPGYVEPGDTSSYSAEREAELRTLCDPRIRQVLTRLPIQLVSYHDIGRLLETAPAVKGTPCPQLS